MWNDVLIGEGSIGNSAVLIGRIEGKHSISENSLSYWIGDLFLDTRIVIKKDTEEGKTLTKLIQEGADLTKIIEFVENVLLSNIPSDRLKILINRVIDRAISIGKEMKLAEIREVLQLY